MQPPVLITPPSEQVLSLEETKRHCRVDSSDFDTEIQALIDTATTHLDGYSGTLGRCLCNQEWQIQGSCFGYDIAITLPFPDVSSVSVKYLDRDGQEQVFSDVNYELGNSYLGSFIQLKSGVSWPEINGSLSAVSIQFVAGYGGAEDVPADIKTAMLMMIGHWFEHSESVAVGVGASEVPLSSQFLLNKYRFRKF
ncbi:head-tail connector protein [Flexibacterium corallicola]|uniref:head-tail connector protein n=1 Tax=Flexibacterium corallicola TaxID=3037259 RepID=UPI00286F9A6B|nr:head-tail connector protein [Pseudovibrio sp. M1P-2-3]